MSELLEVTGLRAGYGALEVVRGLNFTVRSGQVVCLVGANGAGKSTALHALTGLAKARGGRVEFNGTDVTGWNARRLAQAGLVHVVEGNRTFGRMTVLENIEVGAFGLGRRLRPETLDSIYSLFPILSRRAGQPAANLSGGEKKMLAMARGLAAEPTLLVLDEPTSGLAPVVIDEVADRICALNEGGLSMLISEQGLELPDRTTAYTYLISRGETRWEGVAGNLRDVPEVLTAVVGEGVEDLQLESTASQDN